jgi:hypothetical protein
VRQTSKAGQHGNTRRLRGVMRCWRHRRSTWASAKRWRPDHLPCRAHAGGAVGRVVIGSLERSHAQYPGGRTRLAETQESSTRSRSRRRNAGEELGSVQLTRHPFHVFGVIGGAVDAGVCARQRSRPALEHPGGGRPPQLATNRIGRVPWGRAGTPARPRIDLITIAASHRVCSGGFPALRATADTLAPGSSVAAWARQRKEADTSSRARSRICSRSMRRASIRNPPRSKVPSPISKVSSRCGPASTSIRQPVPNRARPSCSDKPPYRPLKDQWLIAVKGKRETWAR